MASIDKNKEEFIIAKYKVLFHIDENKKWKLLLANVSNLLDAIDGKSYNVKVVANAEAVKYYDPSQNLDRDVNAMKELKAKGVEFIACNNALRTHKIEKSHIINLVTIVPAGVLELVERQSQGYAYIKP